MPISLQIVLGLIFKLVVAPMSVLPNDILKAAASINSLFS